MRFILFIFLMSLISCQPRVRKDDENIIQSDDYVLVEFAAKLEESEHQATTAP